MPRQYIPRVTLQCQECGNDFVVQRRMVNTAKYCSHACAQVGHRKKHPRKLIERTCEYCGKAFPARPCEINKGKARFCGRVCNGKGRIRTPDATRFWSKVNKDGPIPEHRPELGPCWVWTGSVNGMGYGQFTVGYVKHNASRSSYALTKGSIPEDLVVCHHCDNPLCVRPDHLFLGTMADNMADKVAKGRQPRGESIPWVKLTESQVLAIRAEHADGTSMNTLAITYNVSRSNISAIIARKTWRHI